MAHVKHDLEISYILIILCENQLMLEPSDCVKKKDRKNML